MANRRYIDFPIASTSGDTDIILIWQDGANKQTTKATFLSGLPENLEDLNDVAISGLTNGQILRYDSVTGKWENTDQGNLDLNDLNDVSIVSPSNGQVLVYNSSTSQWENSSGGFVPYVGAVTTVDLGAQGLRAGYVRFDTTVAGVPNEQGLMFWDADDETVDVILNGYTMKIGEDLFYPVNNQTGSTIAKGTAVRFNGTVGASGRLLIAPFIANGSVPSSRFMGVTAEEILNGEDGKVLYFGRVRGINTDAFNEGDILYASTTVAGGYQTAIPLPPNNIVQVAAVVTKSATVGTIFIRPTLGSNINTDEGVKITSVADKNLLQYQIGTALWENKSLAQVLGGTSAQFVKGDGSLDSTAYGTGTVTSVGLSSATSGVTIGSSPVTTSGTITLAIATASGSQNGLLSSTDWTTFNNKQNALTNPVTGTGTTNYLPKFTGASTIGNSNVINDASGNLGLGVTPSAWSSPYKAFQLGTGIAIGGLMGRTDGINEINFGLNWRYTGGASLTYIASSFATNYYQKQGSHVWQTAPSGTAGNAISFTQAMTLTSVGNLAVGDTATTTLSGYQWIRINGSTGSVLELTSASKRVLQIQADGTSAGAQIQTITGSPLIFGTGAAERARFTSGGNLLIGTTTDNGARLQVSGTAQATKLVSASNAFAGTLDFGTGSFKGIMDYTSSTGLWSLNNQTAGASSTAYFQFQADSTPILTMLKSGNVGIGTTSPNDKLVVDGGNNIWTGVFRGTTTASNSFGIQIFAGTNLDDTSFRILNGATTSTYMIVRGDGNVGIGTVSPSARLEIGGDASPIIRITSTSGPYSQIQSNTVGTLQLMADEGNTAANTSMRFRVDGGEVMRLTSGNVLIGTTTDNGARLQVSGNATATRLLLGTSTATSYRMSIVANSHFDTAGILMQDTNTGGRVYTIGSSITTIGNFEIFDGTAGTLRFSINSSGNARFTSLGTGTVMATGGTLSTVSDSSFKVDDGYIDSALQKVLNLKPRYFYWNNKSGLPTDVRQLGFYAQEVNQALGEEVANTPKDSTTAWGIADRSLIAMLTKAIQELKQEIDTLKN